MAKLQKQLLKGKTELSYMKKLSLTGAEISLNELPLAGANVPFVHSHKENEEEIYGIFSVNGKAN